MSNNWTVTYEGFDEKEHPLQEALCTLGNGYFCTRGALEMMPHKVKVKKSADKDVKVKIIQGEGGKEWNYPGTYLAGGYNRMESRDGLIENEDLVNWPNWLYLTFRIEEGPWFDFSEAEILEYKTRLYLKEAFLERVIHFRDQQGRETLLVSRRVVSMEHYHAGGIQWEFTPQNWSGEVTFRSGLDGQIINNNVERYSDLNQDHIEVLKMGHFSHNSLYMHSRSKQSRINIAQGTRTRIFQGNEKLHLKQKIVHREGFIAGDFKVECQQRQATRLEKMVSFYSSRDMAISDPLTEACTLLERLGDFQQMLETQKKIWLQFWNRNDIVMETPQDVDQLVIRLHIFHIHQTVSHNSIDYDIGVPARGWHGEAYRGHIFWDELYILPFISLQMPQLSRSLLMYRYRRLSEAVHSARKAGFRGAIFPWQSGSNGREETQKIHLNPISGRWLPDVSHLQYHINAAIPFNVWNYYQSTGDMDFMLSHGAEIIFSTALFWSSISVFNQERGRYEIRNVMGPDEYHTHYPDREEPGLHNNAYTNIMAVWVIQHALNMMDLLDEPCCNDLESIVGFTAEDVEKWQDITHKMYVPFQDNIIMQFEGYQNLRELDWEHYYQKYGRTSLRLDRILEAEGDSCNYYKASKQADVLMLFYLFSSEELTKIFEKLGYEFSPESIPENIEYYRKRTAHGSTLSQVIHSWVYARSHREESWNRFRQALMSDFRDVQGGTTHEGIHLGAMAGTLDLVQRCYSGMEIRDDVLWVNPRLPADVKSMSFHVRYRSHWIKMDIDQRRVYIEFDKGWANPVTIGVCGITHRFETNDKKEFNL